MRTRAFSWALVIAIIAATQSAVAAPVSSTEGSDKAAQTGGIHKRSAAQQDAALRALGVILSRQLVSFQLSEAEFKAVVAGFADGYHHPAVVKDAQAFVPQLQALERSRIMAAAQREEQGGRIYLNKVAALRGAQKTTSGMVFVPLAEGSGATPKTGDQVKVRYTGKLIDGSVFDSSALHGGEPATFTLGQVIPCWTEGLQLMKVGGKARLVCPPALAYGERGAGDVIKPGATLDFDVELLDVQHRAVAVPSTPSAPPAHQ